MATRRPGDVLVNEGATNASNCTEAVNIAVAKALETLNKTLTVAGEVGAPPPPFPPSTSILNQTQSEEQIASLSITFLLLPLMVALVLGSILKYHRVRMLSVAGAALVIGLGTGLAAKLLLQQRSFLIFSQDFFFLALLPPIIFESGWSIKKRPFFRNFGIIMALAFVGTTLSSFIIGLLLWFASLLGLSPKMRFLHHLIFGSIISATDPVTTLSVFGEVQAAEDLFAIVLGESILNDAASVVLYRTLLFFRSQPLTLTSLIEGLGLFHLVFLGSTIIGVGVALASSLFFRTGKFRTSPGDESNPLEVSLVLLFPYVAYTLADGLGASGIVSVLFCGIVMGHYTRQNLSESAEQWTHHFFKLTASLSELFVFVYLGTSVFLVNETFKHPSHIFWALLGCLIGRAAFVYPLCDFFNKYVREPRNRISSRFQHMINFSGLRGAVAFALAIGASDDLNKEDGAVFMSSTVFIIFSTVLVFGGTTHSLLERLKLRAQDQQESKELDRIELARLHGSQGGPNYRSEEPGSPSRVILKAQRPTSLRRVIERVLHFETIDRHVLQPVFVNPAFAAEHRLRRDGGSDRGDLPSTAASREDALEMGVPPNFPSRQRPGPLVPFPPQGPGIIGGPNPRVPPLGPHSTVPRPPPGLPPPTLPIPFAGPTGKAPLPNINKRLPPPNPLHAD